MRATILRILSVAIEEVQEVASFGPYRGEMERRNAPLGNINNYKIIRNFVNHLKTIISNKKNVPVQYKLTNL